MFLDSGNIISDETLILHTESNNGGKSSLTDILFCPVFTATAESFISPTELAVLDSLMNGGTALSLKVIICIPDTQL